MTTIGNIGIGIFSLIVLWVITLFIFVHAIRSQNNVGWLVLVISACITITLVIIPTEVKYEKKEQLGEDNYKDKIYRTVLSVFFVISTLTSCVFFFFLHCIKPVQPRLVN